MANTFGILAAVALLFGAFVAHKNKGNLENVIAQIGTEERNLEKQTGTHQGLLADIDSLEEEKAAYDATRTENESLLEKQIETNSALESEIASKKSEADSAKSTADEADDKLKALGPVDELIPEMKSLRNAVADLDDEISANSAVVDRLEGTKSATAAQAQDLAEKLAQRTKGTSYFSSTSVRTVFRQWGFVTLAGGDNIGVVKKSKLSVVRNGEEIAQLIVTGVEANTAAANIIPSSVKEGETVSPGDKVVPLEAEAK
ncbi:MAG: hypothetical protein ACSHYF_07365 [Verrucomicrobiaceae bacterium]